MWHGQAAALGGLPVASNLGHPFSGAKLAREGWLGELFEAHAVMSKSMTAAARKEIAEYPGGSMLELGCHGEWRRQFVVCGELGTHPLEAPKMQLAQHKARDPYKAGYQEVTLPAMTGRYDGEFIDLAKIVRGEKAADFSYEHDLATHESILLASGVATEPTKK